MASFAKFSAFYPYVIDTIIEASADDVLRATQLAVRQFATDTEWFNETYTVDLVAGQTTYSIESNYDARNLRVLSITINGQAPTSTDYALAGNGRTVTLTNAPADNVTDGLVLTCVTMPDLDCDELDEDQMESMPEAIISLTKHILYRMPRKPWSDPIQSQFYKGLYDGYTENLSTNSLLGGQSGSTSINLGARI